MKNLLIRSLPILIVGTLINTAQPQDKRAEFEVASVKPNTSGNNLITIRPPLGGLFRATNARVKALVSIAYDVRPSEISGGPGWIETDGFDIEAKAADANAPIGPMLQSLLEDRFQLKVHRETKEVPVYALTLPKGPSKLPDAKEGGCTEIDPQKPPAPPTPGQLPPTPCGGFLGVPGHLEGGKISMARLAKALTGILGRPVIDKTGFTGTFDVKLDYNRDGTFFAPTGRLQSAPNSDTPDIFTALQDVLGVKLESTKQPGNTLYIDHVEKPSEN